MKCYRSIIEGLQATIDNKNLDIETMQRQIRDLNKKLAAASARNQDLKKLVGMQASQLVAKDQMIMILQKEIAT